MQKQIYQDESGGWVVRFRFTDDPLWVTRVVGDERLARAYYRALVTGEGSK